jgi:hypothetical protein
MEILVPSSKGTAEVYFPPSMTGRAQEAPDGEPGDKASSWWQRFRRVLKTDEPASGGGGQ